MITPVTFFQTGVMQVKRPQNTTRYTTLNPVQDIYTPSFSGEDFQTRFDSELKHLNGIRCARCNQRTLSEDKYNDIKQKMVAVKNGHELLSLINENKAYLKNSSSLILKDLAYINEKYPDADIGKVISKIHHHAPLYYAKTCESNINLLELVSQKLDMSENDRKHYKKVAKDLKFLNDNKFYNFYEFKIIMNSTLKETNYPKRRKLFDKVLRQQGRAHKYYKDITAKNLISLEPHKALEELCDSLFGRAVSRVTDICKAEPKYKYVNKILICSDCDDATQKLHRYYKNIDDDAELKNNFIQYIQDLNRAIDNKELNIDKNYLNSLIKHVRYASGKKIALNNNDYQFLQYRTQISGFPFEDKEGIPCPKCNATMLTYAQKEKFGQRIHESDSIKELSDIFKETEPYLPPTAKLYVKKFRDCYIRDPYITDTLMRKNMQIFANSLAYKEIRTFIQEIKNKLNDATVSDEDKRVLKQLRDDLFNYTRHHSLFYKKSDIINLIEKTNLVEPEDKVGLKYAYDDFLVSLEVIQNPVYHSKELSTKNTWSKIFATRILQKCVITKDHMISRKAGGADELDNTMALHRECNQKKDKKPLGKWFKEDEKTEEYSANYLRKINELAKNKEISNCDDYAENFAQKISLFAGKDKLKKEFCKK